VERGIPAGKVSVIKNGVDLSRFQPRPRDEQLAAELALTGKIVVGYVGTHGMAHGLGTLLNAAELLQKEPCDAEKVHFLFLGDGAEKEALKAEAARKALRNVTFVHSVSRGEVARYWSLIDIAVIHLKKAPLFTMVIPSKMFECMAMGIPVLHGVAGESADIVVREGIGLIFEPENANALAVRVRELATDPARREELARRGIEAARRYDRTALARQMLDTLRSVCEALPAASTLFPRNKLGKPG
jgi:glycosyltransferase involved in cell wall biosynthesis